MKIEAILSRERLLSLPFIIGCAFLLRLVWALIVPIAPVSDPGAYHTFANTLLSHGVYGFEPEHPIATWPPGTAAFYAMIYALPGSDLAAAKIANVLISVLNVWLIWAVGRELFNDLTGRLAALAMAIWPQMIYFTTILASEPIFICLILTAVLCWHRGHTMRLGWVIAAGILFGLACYIRSVGLLLPIVLTFGALVVGSTSLRYALGRLAIVVALMGVIIAPWTMRNQQVFGDTILMSSNFGGTLYMGNGPGTTGRHASADMPDELREQLQGLSQPERSSILGELAKKEIRDNPGAFVVRSLKKTVIIHDRETIGVEWNRMGLQQISVGKTGSILLKFIATAFWWVVLLGGIVGLCWQVARGSGWRFLFSTPALVWFYFAGIHAVVLASDRFHMPQAPFIAMIAASFVANWLQQKMRQNTE